MCHLDTAQCKILKDSGRFLVKIPRGLGLKNGKLSDFFFVDDEIHIS